MQQRISFEARVRKLAQSIVNVFHYFGRNGDGLPK